MNPNFYTNHPSHELVFGLILKISSIRLISNKRCKITNATETICNLSIDHRDESLIHVDISQTCLVMCCFERKINVLIP